MLETTAFVTRTQGELAWVKIQPPSACGACGGRGCGSSVWARLWHAREPEYPVANPIDARPGEQVIVGLEEGVLLKAAVAGYLYPLALLLAGALLGTLYNEATAVLGALAGLFVGGWTLRRCRQLRRPIILRRAGVPGEEAFIHSDTRSRGKR